MTDKTFINIYLFIYIFAYLLVDFKNFIINTHYI